MRKFTDLAIAIGAGLCLCVIARADDVQFTTLPQTVQTTVIHETRIPDSSSVTHVIRDSNGLYVVTVRGATGEQTVYVNEAGLAVQAPATVAVVQKSAETVQPVAGSPQTVTTYDQVQQNTSRYQLLEKKGKKEVYRDNQTGQKVTVKRDN
jgi:hypothetical protein